MSSFGDTGPSVVSGEAGSSQPVSIGVVNSAVAPVEPYVGLLWYDRTVRAFKEWSGTVWITVEGGDGAPVPPSDGRIYGYKNGAPVDLTDSLIDPPL